MKIEIQSFGKDIDDGLVRYIIRVENNDFKGAKEFYEYPDIFNKLGKKVLDFPFNSKDDVELILKDQGLRLSFRLGNLSGKILTSVDIRREDGRVSFEDSSIETESLHHFAKQIINADFNDPQDIQSHLL